jgi:hypothetical protein
MKVTYTELIEEDEFYYDLDDEHAIFGHIDANDQIIVRYCAYWTNEFPARKVIFDIIFFRVDDFERSVPSEAISVEDTGVGHLYFKDATTRPFASGQARHCVFPQPASGSVENVEDIDEIDDTNDIASVAIRTVDFIYRHDTRLKGCFEKTA